MLIISYMRIVYFLLKERRSVGTSTGQNQNQFNLMKRTTVLVTLVVTIYIVTTAPAAIYILLLTVSGNDITRSQVHVFGILSLIYYCNSIINPVIYASRIPVFKEAYSKIVRRVFKIGKNQTDVLHVREVNQLESRSSSIPLEPRRDVES